MFLILSGLLALSLAANVSAHVEIEAEDYFFPLEPVIFIFNYFL